MKLNLVSDHGGRSFARAMQQAYAMGYADAKQLKDEGRRIYPRKTGKKIASEIASKARDEHCTFLRQAYSAGMFQFINT